MPAFKASFLKAAIDSILAQSYSNFELIIVNDASPEDLERIIETYNDNRIKYYKNPTNIGGENLIAQWNKCISYANNEYLILTSDDDVYDKDFLYQMSQMIKKYPDVDVFHSRVQIIDSNDKIIDYSAACVEWETCQEFIWHRICKGRAQYIPEFIFRKKALIDKGGFIDFPSAWGSDHATAFLIAKEKGVVCCNLPLLKWRYSGLNISSSGKHLECKIKGLFQYYSWIKKFISDFEGSFYKTLIKNEIDIYLQKRIVDLLSQYSFWKLFIKLLQPSYEFKEIRKKHVVIACFIKMKKVVSYS